MEFVTREFKVNTTEMSPLVLPVGFPLTSLTYTVWAAITSDVCQCINKSLYTHQWDPNLIICPSKCRIGSDYCSTIVSSAAASAAAVSGTRSAAVGMK
jgi:hypothetical protein